MNIFDDLQIELTQLLNFFKLGLDVGEKILTCPAEDVEKHTNHRHRILNKTSELSVKINLLLQQFDDLNPAPAQKQSINALKNKIFELGPKFEFQNRKIQTYLSKLKIAIRSQLVTHQKSKTAIKAYMKSPSRETRIL